MQENWRKHLTAAEGFLELRLFDDAANELEHIPPQFKVHRDILVFRLNLYMQSERWYYAMAIAETFVASEPGNSKWWLALGYSTRQAKDVENALNVMRQAVIVHPKDYQLHYNRACYAAQTGAIEEAKEACSIAFKLHPDVRLTALDDPDLEPVWSII